MAELFKGAPVSAALSERIRADVQALGARGVMPRLAIVRAGASPDDLAYERGASKRRQPATPFCRTRMWTG